MTESTGLEFWRGICNWMTFHYDTPSMFRLETHETLTFSHPCFHRATLHMLLHHEREWLLLFCLGVLDVATWKLFDHDDDAG